MIGTNSILGCLQISRSRRVKLQNSARHIECPWFCKCLQQLILFLRKQDGIHVFNDCQEVRDIMSKRKANLDDGCSPELVVGAEFDGVLEIPIIKPPDKIAIPSGITPFTKRKRAVGTDDAIGFFEKDPAFAEVLINPEAYVDDFLRFRYLFPVDCSMYRDAPLAVQVTNLYRSRAIGSFYQRRGANVYTLIRWGNEYTYTKKYFPERIAFLGAPKRSALCIGTYGCVHSRRDKYYFKAGLDAMLETLEPVLVLVYGSMPDKIFGDYLAYTTFVPFTDWTKRAHGGDA